MLQTLGSDNTKFEAVVEKREHIPVQNSSATFTPETPAADLAAVDSSASTTKADPKDIATQTAAAFTPNSPEETVAKKSTLPQSNMEFGNTP